MLDKELWRIWSFRRCNSSPATIYMFFYFYPYLRPVQEFQGLDLERLPH